MKHYHWFSKCGLAGRQCTYMRFDTILCLLGELHQAETRVQIGSPRCSAMQYISLSLFVVNALLNVQQDRCDCQIGKTTAYLSFDHGILRRIRSGLSISVGAQNFKSWSVNATTLANGETPWFHFVQSLQFALSITVLPVSTDHKSCRKFVCNCVFVCNCMHVFVTYILHYLSVRFSKTLP